MPIVNYVREHNRFIEYASDEHLSASERLLWYALMHIFNARAQGNVWPGEFIRISNDRLLTFCPMRFDALAAARNGLKQRGLIDYVKGEKNKTSPMYRMVYFFPEELPPESQSCPEKTDNIGGNMGGKPGGNIGGNVGGNVGDNSINLTEDKKGLCEDEEEEGARAGVSAEEMRGAWRTHFGRDPGPAVGEELARRADLLGFGAELMEMAISITAVRCTDSPMDYLGEVLRDWKSAKVRTVQDAERYLYLRDAVREGRDGALGELTGFRERGRDE